MFGTSVFFSCSSRPRQQSRRAGCITGAVYTDYCADAREMLRPLELAAGLDLLAASSSDWCELKLPTLLFVPCRNLPEGACLVA